MHKGRNFAICNRFGNLFGRDAGRHRNASARERLADTHNIRLNASMLMPESRHFLTRRAVTNVLPTSVPVAVMK